MRAPARGLLPRSESSDDGGDSVGDQINDSLALVQETELELCSCVDAICRKHNLTYSLAFGSLIGAVRHKGFIPWDDDIDILMPRPDFDRLLEVIGTELPPYFELQFFTFHNTHRYVARLIDHRTLIKLSSYGEGNELAIWLDIFPLDGIPDNGFLRRLHYGRIKWHKAMCAFASFNETVNRHRPGRPLAQQLIIDFCAKTHFGSWLDIDERLAKYDKALRKYGYAENGHCFCGVGTYDAKKQTWKRACFDRVVDYEFDGRSFMGPEDYDSLLSVTYNDYMTLPPEDKRVVHHIDLLEHPHMN